MGCRDDAPEYESYGDTIKRLCDELGCTENEVRLAYLFSDAEFRQKEIITRLKAVIKQYVSGETQ